MQTFLPYPSFTKSASVLDYRRLGNQRKECKQILQAIYLKTKWRHHPIVKMWTGYELALCEYYNAMIEEWVSRGYNNNMPRINLMGLTIIYPTWLGDESFHLSHRSNLLRKNPEYYQSYFTSVPDDLPYIWF